MNFQQKIEKSLFSRKYKNEFKAFHEIIFLLGKELGWSPKDIIDSPMPLIMGILSELQAHNKRQEKAMKKKR